MVKGAATTPAAEPDQNDTAMADVPAPPNTDDAEPASTEQPSQDAPQAEPSQPSEPAPPPGIVPGPRAQQLVTLHAKALSATLRTISLSTFKGCFPTIAASAPDVLASIHAQFISRLQTFAEADLKEILRERKVIQNLNALEELILDAKRRQANAAKSGKGNDAEEDKPLPGHLQPPEKLLEAHLIGTLEGARSKLNAKEQTLQSTNANLFQNVQAQYKEIEELTSGLEALVRDLEGVGEMVQDV